MDDEPVDIQPIDDLLGAFALDAVDDHERRQVEAYLATDPRARAEVESMREVASMLAFTSDRPPEGLWDRIADALEGTPPTPGPELARVLPARPRPRWRGALVAGAGALVAAAAAVAITVVVLNDDQSPAGGQDAIAAAYEEALAEPGGRTTELRSDDQTLSADAIVTSSGIGYLAAGGLPPLPDDETYQLWGVYGDEDVISLGVIGNRPEVEPFAAGDEVVALVITREQAGGVTSSSSGALLVGELA